MRSIAKIMWCALLLFVSCPGDKSPRVSQDLYVPKKGFVNWWFEPILYPKGELDLLGGENASTQENYAKMLGTLAMYWVDPGTVIIANKWCDYYGDPRPDPEKWPAMHAFIDTYQQRGQRVVLCVKIWNPEGLPAEECLIKDGKPIAPDPFNPQFESHLRKVIRRILSSDKDCLNASGVMLENFGDYQQFGGPELAKRLVEIIHTEAKKTKPDALLIADTIAPWLGGKVDMLYLQPVKEKDRPFKESISSLAKKANKSCPDTFLAWGIYPVYSRKEWDELLPVQVSASEEMCKEMSRYDPGVIVPQPTVCPVFHYVSRAGRDKEDEFTREDYRMLYAIKQNYRYKFMYSHPISIRRIKPKTVSWSPLAKDQIIAQPFIQPIVSSGGYDTKGIKRAIVWLNNTRMTGNFELIDATRNLQDPTRQAVVYTGKLKPAGRHIWGGNNLIADFSDFQKPGFYFVRLHLDQTIEVVDSSRFVIEDNFYLSRAIQCGHWFYYQRCGTEIPGWFGPCHLDDAVLPDGKKRHFTGGWHDAGDYNKWSHYAYFGVIPLLELEELIREFDCEVNTTLPSALEEAEWELDYLLKVITPEGFLMSVAGAGVNPWLCLGRPEAEFTRMARVEYGESPRVTAWTAAAFLKASLLTHDSKKRNKYLETGQRLYQIASEWGPGHSLYQPFKNDYLEIQSALLCSELAFIKAGIEPERYQKEALKHVEAILAQQDPEGFFYTDKDRTNKTDQHGFSLLPLYHFIQFPWAADLKERITQAFVRWAEFSKMSRKLTPFGVVGRVNFDENKIYCGPSGNIGAGAAGWVLATTAILTGKCQYLDEAQLQMLWVLGLNPTALSMMAGVGNNPRCYHHRYAAIPPGGKELVPGGILNGICFARQGEPFQIGDLNTQNYVIGDNLPTDYPVLDDDLFGWTWGYASNEYFSLNSGFFILMATQIERAKRILEK